MRTKLFSNYMETAQTITFDMDMQEQALRVVKALGEADDNEMKLAEIEADAYGIMQLWLERKNALTNEEREARVMVREYGDMLTTARAAKLGVNLNSYTAAKWLQFTTKDEWLSILPAFNFALEMRAKHQARIEEINAEIFEISEALEYLSEYLTGSTPSVSTSDDLPFETQPAAGSEVALSMDTFDALVKTHIGDVISYVERHRDLREADETALTEAVITEISRGNVSAEDVLQSFDEVLDERYAAFYEHLNERYAQNPKFYQSELAQCVEAYA